MVADLVQLVSGPKVTFSSQSNSRVQTVLLFRTMLRNLFADHHAQEAVVNQSPLDWTIVRAAILKDDPATGSYTATNTGKITKINRADVAACLVDQLDDPANSRQAIAVTA